MGKFTYNATTVRAGMDYFMKSKDRVENVYTTDFKGSCICTSANKAAQQMKKDINTVFSKVVSNYILVSQWWSNFDGDVKNAQKILANDADAKAFFGAQFVLNGDGFPDIDDAALEDDSIDPTDPTTWGDKTNSGKIKIGVNPEDGKVTTDEEKPAYLGKLEKGQKLTSEDKAEIVADVKRGVYGNDDERIKKLKEVGLNWDRVQSEVNKDVIGSRGPLTKEQATSNWRLDNQQSKKGSSKPTKKGSFEQKISLEDLSFAPNYIGNTKISPKD